MTLTQVLQTQDQLWTSLNNPRAAMQELVGETRPPLVLHATIRSQETRKRVGMGGMIRI